MPTHPPQADLAFTMPTHPPQADLAFRMPTHPPQADLAFTMPTRPPQADLAFTMPTHPPQQGALALASSTAADLSAEGATGLKLGDGISGTPRRTCRRIGVSA
jgi:hypothetical protein